MKPEGKRLFGLFLTWHQTGDGCGRSLGAR
jgi:hypothetical protein